MPLKPKPISYSLSLSFSLSLQLFFCSSIFCEKGIYKITNIITWKTNIKWRKPFIFEINKIKSRRVQEVGKGDGTKSSNLLYLWLKLVIDKKMRWGKRLNEIQFIQSATWHNLMLSRMRSLLYTLVIDPCFAWFFFLIYNIYIYIYKSRFVITKGILHLKENILLLLLLLL